MLLEENRIVSILAEVQKDSALEELELNAAWRYWAYPARKGHFPRISHIRQAEASFWKRSEAQRLFCTLKVPKTPWSKCI